MMALVMNAVKGPVANRVILTEVTSQCAGESEILTTRAVYDIIIHHRRDDYEEEDDDDGDDDGYPEILEILKIHTKISNPGKSGESAEHIITSSPPRNSRSTSIAPQLDCTKRKQKDEND